MQYVAARTSMCYRRRYKHFDFVWISISALFIIRSDCEETCSADSTSETCILSRLDSEEKLRAAFNAEPVSYVIHPEYLTPSLQPYERDLTLCTQGSMDRLDRLFEQATAWHGSLSAALYLTPKDVDDASEQATLSRIRSMHEKVESMGKCRLTISLLYGLNSSEVQSEYDSLYPINTLRNLAVNVSNTDLIMVIDIDFIPSRSFWEFCVEAEMFDHLRHAANAKRVWALISLELHDSFIAPPQDKASLAECLKNHSVVVAEAYLNPAAHAPVQVHEWLNTDKETGPLVAGEGFEPFVIGSRAVLPLYDERFRGYGWDKTTHALQLVALGCRYHLLPHHFVVARYHQPTPTAVRIFSDEPDMLLRMRMEWLFALFSTELAELGPTHPDLPRIASHTLAPAARDRRALPHSPS